MKGTGDIMKTIIILITIFFYIASGQADTSPKTKLSYEKFKNTEGIISTTKKSGFLTLGIGNEFIPLDNFIHDRFSIYLRYGRYLSKQSFFSAGIKSAYSDFFNNAYFLQLKYGYDLIKNGAWIPGLDFSIFLGVGNKKYLTSRPLYPYRNESISEQEYQKKILEYDKKLDNYEKERRRFLALGFDLGTYIKSFVSPTTALVLRVGAGHDSSEGWDNFDLMDTKIYINLALQWYF